MDIWIHSLKINGNFRNVCSKSDYKQWLQPPVEFLSICAFFLNSRWSRLRANCKVFGFFKIKVHFWLCDFFFFRVFGAALLSEEKTTGTPRLLWNGHEAFSELKTSHHLLFFCISSEACRHPLLAAGELRGVGGVRPLQRLQCGKLTWIICDFFFFIYRIPECLSNCTKIVFLLSEVRDDQFEHYAAHRYSLQFRCDAC